MILVAGAVGSLAVAADLRAPGSFATITDQAERSRALFVEAGRVLQHPRCPARVCAACRLPVPRSVAT
jgi:hypothetical protein